MSVANRLFANGFPSVEMKKGFKLGLCVKLKNRRVELYHNDEKYLLTLKRNIDGEFKMAISELVLTPEALHALCFLVEKLDGPRPQRPGSVKQVPDLCEENAGDTNGI